MPQLDISTYSSQIFWLLISFFSMYFIMSKIILPQIADILEQRQNKIDDSLNKAEELKKAATISLEKYQQALNNATIKAEKDLNKAQEELEKQIKEKQEELEKRLKEKISQSEQEIESNQEEALKQIQAISENLAINIIQKLDLKEIDEEDIKQASKKVG